MIILQNLKKKKKNLCKRREDVSHHREDHFLLKSYFLRYIQVRWHVDDVNMIIIIISNLFHWLTIGKIGIGGNGGAPGRARELDFCIWAKNEWP